LVNARPPPRAFLRSCDGGGACNLFQRRTRRGDNPAVGRTIAEDKLPATCAMPTVISATLQTPSGPALGPHQTSGSTIRGLSPSVRHRTPGERIPRGRSPAPPLLSPTTQVLKKFYRKPIAPKIWSHKYLRSPSSVVWHMHCAMCRPPTEATSDFYTEHSFV
jgi:hypothetical protein